MIKATALRLLLGLLASIALAHAQAQTQSPDKRFPLPPEDWPPPVMDRELNTYLLLDRLEYRALKGDNALTWDAQAWFGGDYNKLWLKSEGQRIVGGTTEEAELQLLYARRILPFWHLQAGVRREFKPSPSQNSAVLGIQGLAPYQYEVEAMLFMRAGDISGRFEAEYDQLLTQRLILQPRIETNFAGASDAARGIGSGINDVQLGLRLRYEIRREIAPYIGYSWTRKVGNTADIVRARGESATERGVVIGLRVWY